MGFASVRGCARNGVRAVMVVPVAAGVGRGPVAERNRHLSARAVVALPFGDVRWRMGGGDPGGAGALVPPAQAVCSLPFGGLMTG